MSSNISFNVVKAAKKMSISQSLRPIRSTDNPVIAQIIRQVLTEFGANRPGFAFMDPELDDLTRAFSDEKSAYWLALLQDEIVGGAGFGPLVGGDSNTCELKKMYLLPKARGLGLGKKLLENILTAAVQAGYEQIYLETTATMTTAIQLYERFGFQRLSKAWGMTGHHGCEARYARRLVP